MGSHQGGHTIDDQTMLAGIHEQVDILYSSASTPADILQANEWLARFQTNPAMWNLFELTISVNQRSEVRFFGANAALSLVKNNWEGISANHQMQFSMALVREAVNDADLRGRNGQFVAALFVKLIQAVTVCAIHLHDRWPDPLAHLCYQFIMNDSPDENIPLVFRKHALLTMVRVVSEEASSSLLARNRVQSLRDRLRLSSDTYVVSTIADVLTSPTCPPETTCEALRCLVEWSTNELVSCTSVWQRIGPAVFDHLVAAALHSDDCTFDEDNTTVFHNAATALESLLENGALEKEVELCWRKVIPRLLSLQQLAADALSADHKIRLALYSRAVSAFCSTCPAMLLRVPEAQCEQREQALILLRFLEHLAILPGDFGTHDEARESCSDHALNAWTDVCAQREHILNVADTEAAGALAAAALPFFDDVFLSMARGVIRKLQLPLPIFSSLPVGSAIGPNTLPATASVVDDDVVKESAAYRERAVDTLLCLANSDFSEHTFNIVCREALVAALEASDARTVEACLYVLQSLSDNVVTQTQSANVEMALSLLTQAIALHPRVHFRALHLIGALAQFLANNNRYVRPSIELALASMSDHPGAASYALRMVLEENSEWISSDVSIATSLIETVSDNLLAVDVQDAKRLTLGVASLISVLPDPTARVAALQRLCRQPLERLAEVHAQLSSGEGTLAKEMDSACADMLRLLIAAVLKSSMGMEVAAGTVHPAVAVLGDAWPLLSALFASPIGGSAESGRLAWDLIMTFIRTTGRHMRDFVSAIVSAVIGTRRTYGHASTAVAAGVLIGEYGAHPEMAQTVVELLEHVALPFLLAPADWPLRPDLATNTLNMVVKALKHTPHVLLGLSHVLNPLLECVTHLCLAPEHPTARAACHVIQNLCQLSPSHPAAAQALQQCGAMWSRQLLAGIGGHSARDLFPNMTDALLAMGTAAGLDTSVAWCADALATPGFPRPGVSDDDKQAVLDAMRHSGHRKNMYKSGLQLLTESSRHV